jgi:hypothetical protein
MMEDNFTYAIAVLEYIADIIHVPAPLAYWAKILYADWQGWPDI